jgi:DNA-binding transcriptional ArsR family regulator
LCRPGDFDAAHIAAHTLTPIDFRGISTSPMSSDESLNHALQAIADPTRRKILRALKEGATARVGAEGKSGTNPCLCAGDVEERVQLSQPTISHHMAILTKAGLVDATKKGQWRWYRRNEKAIREVVKTLRGKL